ncbi:MAG: (2Fe-2S)-binding protein [Polyangiaceae bacterium]|nr:(2Fe-2S)-binding protein [Polyangiaceae bacterium]
MATILFEKSADRSAVAVTLTEPECLVDVCDRVRAPVEFGCRAARCTTCRIEVLQGLSALNAPNEEESELLQVTGSGEKIRLACQVTVPASEALIHLRWIGPLTAI